VRILRAVAARNILRLSHRISCRLKRLYRFEDEELYVPCGTFNPTYTVSTGLMARALRILRPKGLVLEHGCGSGALSIFVARNFDVSKVICYDISEQSLLAARLNVRLNGVEDRVVVTDRLYNVKEIDFLVSNPPYLPLEPRDPLDLNWCGGRGLEVLRDVVAKAFSLLRRGGILLVSYSSLTGLSVGRLEALGLREVLRLEQRTPLDTVYAVALRRL